MERSKDIVCQLKVIIYSAEDMEYPVDACETTLGLYSSLMKAEAKMRSVSVSPNETAVNKELCNSRKIHHSIIQELGLDPDNPYRGRYNRRVYDADGNLYGIEKPYWEPFGGRNAKECKFSEKEFIEVFIEAEKGQLLVGVITDLPMDPEAAVEANDTLKELGDYYVDQIQDSYYIDVCVDLGAGRLDSTFMPECDIFSPRFTIDPDVKARLLQAYEDFHEDSGL